MGNVVEFGKGGLERSVTISLGTSTNGKIHLECTTHGLTKMEIIAMLEMAKADVMEKMGQ